MIYATGEIILVVIGILIALQINNWNDNVKERNTEQKILLELLSNLEHDLLEIQSDIGAMDSINRSTQDIIQFIETDAQPTEKFRYDVAKLCVNPHFDPNKSGYNLLMSKGVEIILNDNLRESISKLYESLYPYYYRYEEERTQFKLSQINPVLLRYFDWLPQPELVFFGHLHISQADYLKLKMDPGFSRLLHAINFGNTLVQNRAQRVEKGIQSLIDEIKTELE